MNKKTVFALVFLFSICLLIVSLGQTKAATQVNIYAKEITSSEYGFGTSSGHEASPGTTLTFTSGETVTVTMHNEGQMSHNFAIVSDKSSASSVVWGAQVGSSSNPVSPGSSGSVTFTVGSAGNYYYICQVDGHVGLGMWGNVVVNAGVPEFPIPLMLAFGVMAVTALAAYFSKINLKRQLKV